MKSLIESLEAQEAAYLYEVNLKGMAVLRTHSWSPGDFKGYGGSTGGKSVTVSGNAFGIKDELKKLGFRWDSKAKHWRIEHLYSLNRPMRGPSKEKVEKAHKAASKLVNDYNAKVTSANLKTLGDAGYEQNPDPKSERELQKFLSRRGRINSRLARYGLMMDYRAGNVGDEYTIAMSGNTYPVRDLLKDVGFKYDSAKKAWKIKGTSFRKVNLSFFNKLMKALKKEMGDRPAKKMKNTKPSLSDRLARHKIMKQEYGSNYMYNPF